MASFGFRVSISVSGLKELIGRMLGFSLTEKHRMYAQGMQESLEAIHQGVPPYPPPPAASKYTRTEKLGKGMGSGFGGGKGGPPDIYQISVSGGAVEGRFGTSVGYAEYVIGENTQAEVHAGRWWTTRTLLNSVMDKINSIWQAVGARIAAYINGR